MPPSRGWKQKMDPRSCIYQLLRCQQQQEQVYNGPRKKMKLWMKKSTRIFEVESAICSIWLKIHGQTLQMQFKNSQMTAPFSVRTHSRWNRNERMDASMTVCGSNLRFIKRPTENGLHTWIMRCCHWVLIWPRETASLCCRNVALSRFLVNKFVQLLTPCCHTVWISPASFSSLRK